MCADKKRVSHSARRRDGARAGWLASVLFAASAQLVAAPPQSAAVTPTGGLCSARQLVVAEPQQGWRCTVNFGASDAFVVRVDQRDLDVVVSLYDAHGRQALSVDSPTRRASSEMLLIGPRLSGKYALVVRPKAGAVDAQRALVTLDPVSGPASLMAGLAELTRACSPDELQTPDSGKERIAQLQAALVLFQSAGATQWEGETLLRMAWTYYWTLSDWAAAASNARLAMDAFSQVKDPVSNAQAAVARAASLIEIASAVATADTAAGAGQTATQSPLDEPIGLSDTAALVLQKAGFRYAQAEALNFAGIGFFYQGNYGAARARYEQAAAIFRSLRETTSAALPLQNVAHIDFDAGDYGAAIASFKSALDVLDPVANASQYVTVQINMGTAQYVMGQFEGALRSLTMALEICEKRAFIAEQARSLHGLGMVYLVIGDGDRAQVFLERALELRRPLAAQDPRGLQTSLIRVGDLRRERGDVRGALMLHAQALESALSATQEASAFYAVGLDHEQNGATAAAAQAYKSGLQVDLPADFPIRVELMSAYGALQMRSGDISGRKLVERAAQLHEAHGDMDRAAASYMVLAEADRQRQQLALAQRNAQKAVSLHESQRLRAVNPDLRATYLANRAEAAELLVEIYMTLRERSSDPREKQRLAETSLLAVEVGRQRALAAFRSLADSAPGQPSGDLATLDAQLSAKRHRLATLLDQQRPRADMIAALRRDISLLRTQIDLAQTKPIGNQDRVGPQLPKSVAEIQRTLQPHETALVYQLGTRQSRLWAVTRDAVSIAQLASRARLEDAARELYEMWSTPATPVDTARELAASRVILGDKVSGLRPQDTVVVVADGILRSLPFGALLVQDANGTQQRLASTHEVLFRPTLSRAVKAIDEESATAANRILLVGDPTAPSPSSAQTGGPTDPWALPPLPGSRREIQAIAAVTAAWRSYVLLGAEATKPALLSMPLDSFRTIHFATHARLDVQDPQLSSIALSSRDASPAASSSMLTVREIVGFKLNAETVVLSACEASLGKSYRGQLSFGLSEAFLLAGAQNVLGSLWRVSDDAAQEYMKRFYQAYVSRNETPAASAQAAALEMSRDPKFGHPYFWAAFAVTQR